MVNYPYKWLMPPAGKLTLTAKVTHRLNKIFAAIKCFAEKTIEAEFRYSVKESF